MAVSDGQRANQQTFNDAFLSRTQNSDTVAVVGLNHPTSGGLIPNTQQQINDNIGNIAQNASDIVILYATKQDLSEKDQPLGYAGLDVNGKIAVGALPTSVVTAEGNWNASTNTPALTDGSGDLGQFYIVSVAGTTNLGSGSQTFEVGDWVLYNSSNDWVRIINSTSVTSVNGQTGSVVLDLDDIDGVDLTTVPPVTGNALVYDGTDWIPGEGGGSGTGSKNFFDSASSDIENNIGNWETDDGAGSPSAGLTLSLTSVAGELLAGTNSLKVVKDAANRSGHFIKVLSKTIDPSDRGRPNYGSFSFNPGVGYVSSDLTFEVYDVTNAVVLYSGVLADLELLNSRGRFNWVTYLDDTTAQVQFRLKVNNANTNSFAVTFDEFKFGPAAQVSTVYRNSATINLAGSGNFTGGTLRISRVGGLVNITAFSLTYASGSTISSAVGVIPDWAVNPDATVINIANYESTYVVRLYITTSGQFVCQTKDWAGVNFNTTTTGGSLCYSLEDTLTQTITTNQLSQQTIKAKYSGATTTISATTSAGANIIIQPTKVYDSHESYNPSTGEFTVLRAGKLNIKGYFQGGNVSSSSANNGIAVEVFVNGVVRDSLADFRYQVSSVNLGALFGGSCSVDVVRGDIVTVRIFRSAAVTSTSLNGTEQRNWLSFEMNPDLTTLGVVKNDEELTVTGSFTPSSAVYVVSSGVTLTSGTWNLKGILISDNTAGVSTTGLRIHIATGAATAVASPEQLITDNGVSTVRQFAVTSQRGGSGETNTKIKVTSNTTLYLKALSYGAAYASPVAWALVAERIK